MKEIDSKIRKQLKRNQKPSFILFKYWLEIKKLFWIISVLTMSGKKIVISFPKSKLLDIQDSMCNRIPVVIT